MFAVMKMQRTITVKDAFGEPHEVSIEDDEIAGFIPVLKSKYTAYDWAADKYAVFEVTTGEENDS